MKTTDIETSNSRAEAYRREIVRLEKALARRDRHLEWLRLEKLTERLWDRIESQLVLRWTDYFELTRLQVEYTQLLAH